MSRFDRARLLKGVFPFLYPVPTRYSDLDLIGHVNNVAATDLFQEARCRFINSLGLPREQGFQIVVAALSIEFADDMLCPDPVEVSVGVVEIGRSSFRLGHLARQGSRFCAYAEVVQVARNGQGPLPLPEEWRSRLESSKITHPA